MKKIWIGVNVVIGVLLVLLGVYCWWVVESQQRVLAIYSRTQQKHTAVLEKQGAAIAQLAEGLKHVDKAAYEKIESLTQAHNQLVGFVAKKTGSSVKKGEDNAGNQNP